jgi:hypothetical protein
MHTGEVLWGRLCLNGRRCTLLHALWVHQLFITLNLSDGMISAAPCVHVVRPLGVFYGSMPCWGGVDCV